MGSCALSPIAFLALRSRTVGTHLVLGLRLFFVVVVVVVVYGRVQRKAKYFS
jgi:hypothetical protein